MTDDFDSRLKAELLALTRAVPTTRDTASHETDTRMRHGLRVRSAMPIGSLIAAGLLVVAIVGIAPRLAPASLAGSSASASAGDVAVASGGVPTPSHSVSAAGGTGAFTATGSLTESQLFATATVLQDRRVLVTGGVDMIGGPDVNNIKDVPVRPELFDPATGRFSDTGSMVHPRMECTATLLTDGRVLVTGGFDRDEPADDPTAELYDPGTGTFSLTGSMAGPRAGSTATLLKDGRVLVAGGNVEGGPSAETYDPATGKFTVAGNMVTARLGHTATLLTDGRVLIAGGFLSDPPDAGMHELSSAELFDPKTDQFSATGSLKTGRGTHTATLLGDGRVLIIGGLVEHPVELYDPSSGTFSEIKSTITPLHGATAARLASGLVLVAGGFESQGGSVASALLYDPKTETFSNTASLAKSRFSAADALLSDGRVLILGGSSVSLSLGETLDSAEIYDPTGSPPVPAATATPVAATTSEGPARPS